MWTVTLRDSCRWLRGLDSVSHIVPGSRWNTAYKVQAQVNSLVSLRDDISASREDLTEHCKYLERVVLEDLVLEWDQDHQDQDLLVSSHELLKLFAVGLAEFEPRDGMP